MSTISQTREQPIQRSLSYNDLKKKRMVRSMTNKGKFHAIHLQPLSKNQPINNSLEVQYHKKLRKIIKAETVEVLPQTSEHCDKENEHEKNGNRLHLTGQIRSKRQGTKLSLACLKTNNESCKNQSNQRGLALQLCALNRKKTKSTRILTKKISSYNGSSKISEALLKRINGCLKQKSNQICSLSKQQISQYKSAPQNQIKKSQSEEQQYLFINQLSPIKKSDMISASRGEVSGHSLLFDIAEHPDQSDAHEKRRTRGADVSEFKGPLPFPQMQQKMPKIMKKYLPKDFFLRG